ncbi:antitoxin MazE family protein [Caenispirillum bisanense]|uniref:antitoxin MazE family protein n=1 Tax=Caenispirillum bisanense TaxID=414052 RepID=UPI0031D5023D
MGHDWKPTPQEEAEKRAMGLRPMVVWVPDRSAPGYAAEAARQSRNAAQSPEEDDITRFIEETGDFGDEE